MGQDQDQSLKERFEELVQELSLKLWPLLFIIQKVKVDNLQLKEVFSFFPEIELVYRYGSSLKDMKRSKDVDFGILLTGSVSGERRLAIYNALGEKLGKIFKKEIDPVLLNKASPILTYQVLQKGELIYGDRGRAKQFTIQSMTRYFDYMPLHRFFVEQMKNRLNFKASDR